MMPKKCPGISCFFLTALLVFKKKRIIITNGPWQKV